MARLPRILAWGDYGATGLGIALREPMKRLYRTGKFDIALLGVAYDGWDKDDMEYPFKVFPTATDSFPRGNGVLARAVAHFNPDFLFSNLDVGWLDVITHPELHVRTGEIKKELFQFMDLGTRTFKHIGYFPIDGFCIDDKLPKGFKDVLDRINYPVTYSLWTKAVLESHGVKIPANIYHGIDPKVYFRVDKEKARRELIPQDKLDQYMGAFIVQIVATNQHRKKIEDLIVAFAKFADGKQDVGLFIHSQLKMPRNYADIGAHDLLHLIEQVGIDDKTINSAPMLGCDDLTMNLIYNAADIGVLLTEGEGFGLPIIHYHAVGKPILVTDCTACTELTVDELERLPIQYSYIAHANNLVRYGTNLDVLVERLNYFYNNREELDRIGNIGRQDVIDRFDYESVIMPQWIEFWDKVCRESGFPSIK